MKNIAIALMLSTAIYATDTTAAAAAVAPGAAPVAVAAQNQAMSASTAIAKMKDEGGKLSLTTTNSIAAIQAAFATVVEMRKTMNALSPKLGKPVTGEETMMKGMISTLASIAKIVADVSNRDLTKFGSNTGNFAQLTTMQAETAAVVKYMASLAQKSQTVKGDLSKIQPGNALLQTATANELKLSELIPLLSAQSKLFKETTHAAEKATDAEQKIQKAADKAAAQSAKAQASADAAKAKAEAQLAKAQASQAALAAAKAK